MNDKPEREIMTTPETAALLKCHVSSVYRLVKRGLIPHFRVGGEYRFNRGQIEEWTRRDWRKARNG